MQLKEFLNGKTTPRYLSPMKALKMIFYRHRQDLKIPDTELVHCIIFLDEILKVQFNNSKQVLSEVCALMHFAPSLDASVTVFSTTLDPEFLERLKSDSQRPVKLYPLRALQTPNALFEGDVTKQMMSVCLGGVCSDYPFFALCFLASPLLKLAGSLSFRRCFKNGHQWEEGCLAQFSQLKLAGHETKSCGRLKRTYRTNR